MFTRKTTFSTEDPDTDRPTTSTPSRTVSKSILAPLSSRGVITTTATSHGVSRKVAPNPNHGPNNPRSASNNSPAPLRARKTASAQSAESASTKANANRKPIKSYKPLLPLDQHLDNEFEARLSGQKRDRSGNMAGFARRRTQMRREADIGEDVFRLSVNDPQHVSAQLSPIMKLRVGGQEVELQVDEPRDRSRPTVARVEVVQRGPQRALKAARKYESVPQPSDSSDSSDSESDSSESSSSSEGTVQLEDGSKSNSDAEDVIMDDVAQGHSELVLDEEKMITAPLPRTDTVGHAQDLDIPPAPRRHAPQEPTANLVSVAEGLSLSSIRLRRNRQLPFSLRSLRKGFLERCRTLLIPIYPLNKDIQLQVRYSTAGEDVYQVEVDKWLCPICDLFGNFATREMLECHLQWDHQEVYCEWEDLGSRQIQSWRLDLLIQERESHIISPSPRPRPRSSGLPEGTPDSTNTPSTLDIPQIKRSLTPEPAFLPAPSRLSVVPDVDIKREEIEASLRLPPSSALPISSRLTPTSPGIPSGSASRSLSLPGRSDSATLSSASPTRPSTSTVRSISQPTPPPPPKNHHGPAAQPPYLPSDIGGTLILYSCRPGGPCLFDLLATLPMEPFGLLDWEVLDREDEIYESDDVKEEYKVMHALWARWIILNRHKFIANYAKGVIFFVDEYWKMIYWAAGWDALRYFLFIFLANQFLTGHDVAATLTHYEGLTAEMASQKD